MKLSERKEKILAAIVEHFIATGEPVGSKTLLEKSDLNVSSATVRNEMAELAAMGYIEQPHTSAGRVPSQTGYRYYVDNLMNQYDLPIQEKRLIESKIRNANGEPQQILEQAGQVLAEITNCATVSTTPYDEHAVIRRVEIVPIGTRTAMMVMLSSSGILKSKVCRTDVEITVDIIETFYNIVNQHFIGKSADEVSIAMIQTLVLSLGAKSLAMSPLLVTLSDLAQMIEDTQMLLKGQSNLLNYRDYPNVYELMEFLHHDKSLTSVFSSHKTEGTPNILIGKENKFRELQDSSLIYSNYNIGGKESGTIGLIGPTRIDYARLIPSIKYLTEIVGKIISDTLEEQ
ncbi:MAG: heat-inducible transcriptional repressor HrcA [Clostridiales bacterium]|nr:heat-inducible transcriptional repressor HrcA [Clostridiales bacterium]